MKKNLFTLILSFICLVSSAQINHQGRNTVTVEANEFKPGIYMYSLLVDGKLIDTKRMVVTSK